MIVAVAATGTSDATSRHALNAHTHGDVCEPLSIGNATDGRGRAEPEVTVIARQQNFMTQTSCNRRQYNVTKVDYMYKLFNPIKQYKNAA